MKVRVVADVPPDRADELVALYDTWEWWADRDVDEVARAVENSTVVVGLERREAHGGNGGGGDGANADGAVDVGDLVASARVVSDGVYYARIYDVVVDAAHRGEGLGRRLVRETVEHPELDGVDAITLGCEPDLVPFYEDCGFESPAVDFRQLNYDG